MLALGEYHVLKANRSTDFGLYLISQNGEEVLLPTKYVPKDISIGDPIEVFIYLDNLGRPIATTKEPYCTVNEFAFLRVREVSNFGAFMEWGIEKDLLVPFAEQNSKMEAGRSYVVFVHIDPESNRIMASARYRKHLEYNHITVSEGDKVKSLVTRESDLGFQVIVENQYQGLLYRNETFEDLRPGQFVDAYVKMVREDGKIDLTLQKPGYAHVEPNAQKVLEALRHKDGFLDLHDKSDPEEIRQRLGMSKKTFKKAIGLLYKEGTIQILDNGIQLS